MGSKSRGQILVEMARHAVVDEADESELEPPEPYSPSGSEYVPSEASSLLEVTAEVEPSGRPKRGRKRKCPSQNRVLRKKFYNENKKYTSARGKDILPKEFSRHVICGCKKKCTESVEVDERYKLFSQFWSIGSFSARCAFLNAHVKEQKKARTYTKHVQSRRNFSRKYYIGDTEVCKIAFLKTLQITQNRIDVALKKRTEPIIRDERGLKSGGRNKCSDQQISEICQHIDSFPKYISHYCRKETSAKFLNPDLNIPKMYDLYKEQHTDNNTKLVSLSTYKKIFYKYFNLRFKLPQKDTCLVCDMYKSQTLGVNGDRADELKSEHKKHIEKATRLREAMKSDLAEAKSNPEVETLTFDLQKTHPLPKIPTSVAYYKRQLNFYNLGIHIGSSGRGIFNVWTEVTAGRGTQEVGSCLLKYINDNVKAPTKELRLWSDSCGGQNRSIKLVLLLLHCLLNHPSLEVIKMRFLLSGHSFLPNDSEFGDVESALKIQERLYTDDDYIKIMERCRRKKKFVVVRYTKEHFVSVENIMKSITNRKTDETKQKVSWLDCHEIELQKTAPAILLMKTDVDNSIKPQRVNIEKSGKGRKPVLKDIELPLLWPEGKPLSIEKSADLKYILKLVPKDAKDFYKFLLVSKTSQFEDDIEGFGGDVDFEIEELEEQDVPNQPNR